MRFESNQPNSPKHFKPKTVSTNRDAVSKAVRRRLYMLFAMLILVTFAMYEAGKPERWEWMGFDKTEIEAPAGNDGNLEANSPPDSKASPGSTDETDSASFSDSRDSGNRMATANTSPTTSLAPASPGSSQPFKLAPEQTLLKPIDRSDYPAAAARFWSEAFRKLNDEDQDTLLELVRYIRTSRLPSDGDQPAFRRLVVNLKRDRERFHQDLFDTLTMTPDGSDEKKELSDEYYECKEIWEEKIEPALSTTVEQQDITLSQQQGIIRLQRILDQFIFANIQDRTSLGWTGDRFGWLRTWELLLEPFPKPKKLTRIELISKPDSHRGKPIQIEGWVRGGKIERLEDSALGIDQTYVFWVRPKESKAGPYNVYVKKLPEGFPELTEQLTELNEQVIIKGYFFKVRTYVAADRSVQYSPVIVANTLETIQPVEFGAKEQLKPTANILIGALIILPVLAGFVAWWAYRSSETPTAQPSKTASNQIHSTLEDLSNDPEILSDKEKVMSLYNQVDSTEDPS